MAVATGTALLIAGGLSAATSLATTAMAPKPPSLPALEQPKLQQSKKTAQTELANAIRARKGGGVAKPNTLLTGSGGVGDEQLNLGGGLLSGK